MAKAAKSLHPNNAKIAGKPWLSRLFALFSTHYLFSKRASDIRQDSVTERTSEFSKKNPASKMYTTHKKIVEDPNPSNWTVRWTVHRRRLDDADTIM